MKIYTARYGNSRSIKKLDAVPVRTSIGSPRAAFHYESVTELAPYGLLGLPHDLYRPQYMDKLTALGVDRVRQLLLDAGGGRDVILLCYENLLKPDSWCHRRMIAEWWTEATGEPVIELEDRITRPSKPRKVQMLGHSVSKGVYDKARRLNREGKVKYLGEGIWEVEGDSGHWRTNEDRCSCPTDPNLMCSHRLAVKMRDGDGRLFDA